MLYSALWPWEFLGQGDQVLSLLLSQGVSDRAARDVATECLTLQLISKAFTLQLGTGSYRNSSHYLLWPEAAEGRSGTARKSEAC